MLYFIILIETNFSLRLESLFTAKVKTYAVNEFTCYVIYNITSGSGTQLKVLRLLFLKKNCISVTLLFYQKIQCTLCKHAEFTPPVGLR